MNTLPFQKISIKELAKLIGHNGQIQSMVNVCGFLLCQKGWAKVSVGEKNFTITQGDMYIYAPSSFIHIIDWSEDMEGIAFKSTLEHILPYLERTSSHKTILNIRTAPCVTLTQEQQDNIEDLARIIDKKIAFLDSLKEGSLPRHFTLREVECLAEAFISEFLLYYISNLGKETEIINSKDRIIQDFLLCLFQHYKKQREVKFYAEQQFLTPRYLSTIIKEQTGKTALTWISEMVTSNACQMLAYSDMSIKEIAQELNFPTQSFFGKYFKQYMHCSPLQYRQQHKYTKKN
ncbi:MAG: helix-turn-helix transcriptional regulator [Bacteroidaceae bacterium]|nr:helix-turn-helix transcriptional regulator [Bacteroidaceae bacterium]